MPAVGEQPARVDIVATAALNASVDVKVLSERLGHANTSITRDLYQHVSPENDEAAAETAPRSILGPERYLPHSHARSHEQAEGPRPCR